LVGEKDEHHIVSKRHRDDLDSNVDMRQQLSSNPKTIHQAHEELEPRNGLMAVGLWRLLREIFWIIM